jgi:vibriolysin
VVTLTVTDDAGSKTLSTQTITVGATTAEPFAEFTPTKNGLTVTVNASASKPSTGGTIVNYKFDYGDGNFENVTGPIQSHTYAVAGTYVILLEITDSNGKKASVNHSITVP